MLCHSSYQRNNQCDGKTAYRNYTAARRAVRWLKREKGVSIKGMNAYRCKFCQSWHIGHSTDRQLDLLKKVFRENEVRDLGATKRISHNERQQRVIEGRQLAAARKAVGLRVVDVSDRTGIPFGTLASIEAGNAAPDEERALKLRAVCKEPALFQSVIAFSKDPEEAEAKISAGRELPALQMPSLEVPAQGIADKHIPVPRDYVAVEPVPEEHHDLQAPLFFKLPLLNFAEYQRAYDDAHNCLGGIWSRLAPLAAKLRIKSETGESGTEYLLRIVEVLAERELNRKPPEEFTPHKALEVLRAFVNEADSEVEEALIDAFEAGRQELAA